MKEDITKMIWKKMDELRTSIHFSGYGRFSSTSTLERIGNEIGIDHLQMVISDTKLFKTANSPMQVIPKFIYDFIKLFVNDLRPKNIFDPWLTRDSYPIIQNFTRRKY